MSPTLGGVAAPGRRPAAPTIPRRPQTPGLFDDAPAAPSRRQRMLTAGALAVGAVALVLGYLRMARGTPTNSDAAANALQAWDMLHGNVLLSGWTLSDVSFYSTELVQYAFIELFRGLDDDVVHLASAITYVLLIVLAALVARGDATGRAGWARAGLAVATLLVPQPHGGWAVVLYAPDHTGTSVPLLLAWLLLDRRAASPLRRWWPAGVLVVLALAQLGDPLALFIGAAPLALVSAVRMVKSRTVRGTDAQLLLAALGSAALAHGLLAAIWWAGGFSVHSPVARFSTVDALGDHAVRAVTGTSQNYGAYLPSLSGPVDLAAGGVNVVLLLLAAVAAGLTVVRVFTRADTDLVAEVLTCGILVNLAAYVASTQATDAGSARQIVAVLPLGAALTGRVWSCSGRLPSRALAAATVVLAVAFTSQALTAQAQPPEAAEVAAYLDTHGLRYGLGSYWASNNVTLATAGRVRVAPVIGPQIRSFRWESDAGWYDAGRHDARFVIIDLAHPRYGTTEEAQAQFGPPVERHDFGRWALLVYDHNLLDGLPAECGGLAAASHRHCPPLTPKVPGTALLHD